MLAQNPVEEVAKELRPMRKIRNIILLLILLLILVVVNTAFPDVGMWCNLALLGVAVVCLCRMLRIRRKP